MLKRTLWCGELRTEHIGTEVVVAGWAHRRRDHGGVIFVDLRDRSGLAQVVFEPSHAPEPHAIADRIRNEFVLAVHGKVRERPEGMRNPKLPTGEVEILVDRVEIYNASQPPPFLIEEDVEASEEVRLRHRYLDLRRPVLMENFIRRAKACAAVRKHLADDEEFIEIETPTMTKYTPGGARNYLVPSRVNHGQFYALAESPQLFKQLLMVSGFDRYFQIVRCYRDEDLRADRQPEFTQIDLEMSFVDEDDVMGVVERMLARVWRDVLDVEIQVPFARMTYHDAMDRYGSDKPDVRFDLPLADVSDVVRGCGFGVFDKVLESGGAVYCLRIPSSSLTRKDLDDMPNVVAPYGGKGVAWFKVGAEGEWTGVVAKFFNDDYRARFTKAVGLENGDLAAFLAGDRATAQVCGGALRAWAGRRLGLIDENAWAFCWVTDFPLLERTPEHPHPQALHHPFTSPHPEDIDRLESDPLSVRARAYDVVLNGVELGGGSVRIHEHDVQSRVFQALGLSEEDAREKFGFLLDAFTYGAPPHAGIALGLDRMAMLLSGATSLRDVIAFPKTQRAHDLLVGSPSAVSAEQLAELKIRTTK